LKERFRLTPAGQLRLCSIVKAELLYGARRSDQTAANLRRLIKFFASMKSLPFDDACAEQHAIIRTELARSGKPIGPNDMIIAATAVAHGLTLVTHNTREFSRVPGLALEDWEL